MTTSSESTQPPERVALREEMEARLEEMGNTWQEAAGRGRVKADTLRAARTGTAPIQRTTRVAIDRAMRWEEGSVDTILAGGKPTPLEAGGLHVSARSVSGRGSQVWITLPGGGSPVMVPLVWDLIPGLEDATDAERAQAMEEMVGRMVHAGWAYLHELGAERLRSHKVKKN
ncbi:hypothetical protein ACF07Q_28755 [Nocardiopsis dassonvillei]|uniref:hypothetical protein n=1 Tax=Nocardiopsis dassonvillei TaxID=2014 RepID=UPI0036F92460